jgi:hypothetical protein
MIKSNPLAVMLVSLLFLSALASAWFSLWWFFGARELQALEYHSQSMTRISGAMQSLASDAMEYSRKHPAIDPVLYQFDLKARPGPAGSATPTAAPKNTR